jgi:hypothetical protein
VPIQVDGLKSRIYGHYSDDAAIMRRFITIQESSRCLWAQTQIQVHYVQLGPEAGHRRGGDMRLLVTIGRRGSDWIETVRCFWCRCMHEAAMWPIHGCYRCRTCHRRHPVPWEPGNHYPAAVLSLVQGGEWSNHPLPELPK